MGTGGSLRGAGGARALPIPSRLGFGAAGPKAKPTDGRCQGHREEAANLLRPGTPNAAQTSTHDHGVHNIKSRRIDITTGRFLTDLAVPIPEDSPGLGH